MPKNKKVWSSWNSKIDKKDAKNNTWQGISIKSEEEQATPEFIDIEFDAFPFVNFISSL